MADNRLFKTVTSMDNEYFPNSRKWPELYVIAMNIIERTQRHLLSRLKQIISQGMYKDHEAAGIFLYAELEVEATKLFKEYRDTFPLKSAIKHNPSRVKDFFKKCMDIGQEEFYREIDHSIGYVYYKLDT